MRAGAPAPARIFQRFCAAFQNIDFGIKTVTSKENTENQFSSPTSNRLYSTSFVETSAPGGFPSSGTAVLIDFLKKQTYKNRLRQNQQKESDGSGDRVLLWQLVRVGAVRGSGERPHSSTLGGQRSNFGRGVFCCLF